MTASGISIRWKYNKKKKNESQIILLKRLNTASLHEVKSCPLRTGGWGSDQGSASKGQALRRSRAGGATGRPGPAAFSASLAGRSPAIYPIASLGPSSCVSLHVPLIPNL